MESIVWDESARPGGSGVTTGGVAAAGAATALETRPVASLRRAVILAAAVALPMLASCDSDPVQPQPQGIDLRVIGATEFYTGGIARLDTAVIELSNGIVDLRGRFEGRMSREGTLVLDLFKGDPIIDAEQTTVSFDRYETEVLLKSLNVDTWGIRRRWLKSSS